MGYTIVYRTATPVIGEKRQAVLATAEEIGSAHAWISCEPPLLMPEPESDYLFGCSKPALMIDEEELLELAEEDLPDGTLEDLVVGLCRISQSHGIDWHLGDDYEERVGTISQGVADQALKDKLDELAQLAKAFANGDFGGFGVTE
ncbi:MAG: hypothetical protein AAF266_11905 [Planctomycetota bacterium]